MLACGRQQYYKKTGNEISNMIDDASLLKMHFGKIQHEDMQRILKEKNILLCSEVETNKRKFGLDWKYFIDAIIKDNDKKYILEIKTVYARGFDFVKEEPKKEHFMQCLCYMIFEKILDGIILYIGRDNGFMIQHDIQIRGKDIYLNGELKTKLTNGFKNRIQYLKELKTQIEQGIVPEREYTKKDWQCRYCQYKTSCWSK
jgi:CRISPR/Cas system-associated exonuclease Cas4 (RecB family)